MASKRMVALVVVSLISIHCSEPASEGPNYPGSTENEFSLLFDGVDGFGSAGDISITLGDTIDNFTTSLWLKAAEAPAAGSTVMILNPEHEGGSNSMQVRLYWASSTEINLHITPDFAGQPGATLTSQVPEPQEWNHVVVTFDSQAASGNARLYLNGDEVASGDQSASLTALGNIQFAREEADRGYYHGYLDEVAFWDITLPRDEIAAVYGEGKPKNVRFDFPGYQSADGVRSLWRMGDENFMMEANVSDLVGENHFTIVGGGEFQRDVP